MILGMGTDIIEIKRVKEAILQNSFLEKIYTKKEIASLLYRKDERAAGFFAAKEAMAKALGTGFKNFSPKDIEIQNNDLGKPYIKLYNNAYEIFLDLGGKNIFISISHCKEYAVSVVVIEGNFC